MIDNYDSFTYNLVQYFGELGEDVQVSQRRDHARPRSPRMRPSASSSRPGPCTPNEAGISVPLIKHFAGKLPILGVCLGHQASAGLRRRIVRARKLMHGKTSPIITPARRVPRPAQPVHLHRYHSLVIERAALPDCLESPPGPTTARSWACATRRWRRRRAVPPRIHPDRARPRLLKNFLEDCTRMTAPTHADQPQEALQRVIEHREIFHDEMLSLMRQIMSGEMSPVMIAAILTGLRVKKETIGEIAAAAR
jgi:anthranilate synthase component 2